MSKFEYDSFYGDYSCIGFNANKYTKEKSLEVGAEEYGCNVNDLCIEEAYIYYGFGIDDEGEKQRGYWICETPKRNSFKAWSVYKR